jgi:DNA-binding NarL/FixJ family response regulator
MDARIAIFDDNAKRREGLELLVESLSTHQCVGSFEDCSNVLKDIEGCQPDLILMDIDMPNVNGIDGVLEIRTKDLDVKILMQTVFEDDEKVFAAIRAGADGYILKQAEPGKLLDAIDEVLEGGAPMTPVIARKVLQLFSKQSAPLTKKDFDLTKRETEILEYLVKGFSYKMIAEACFISYPTVNTHVSKIYKKLQVESAAGAVSKAIKEGLF